MNSKTVTLNTPALVTRWILNARLDLLIFIGTPLLIMPVFFAASRRISGADLFLIVSTFGALGHHAPGLMRAYGDKQLFRRFWLRFTLVPIIALTVFMLNSPEELPGVMLLLLSWGVWHFLMQTYGFARIYDAKTGSFDATTRRLDLAVCIGWFGTCILFAESRMTEFLTLALKSGLNSVLDIPLATVRSVWLLGTILATLLFVANVVNKAARGEPVNLARIILFVTTFSFFWLCVVKLTNLLLGVAMFEVFHDIQYLGIVWLFNRNRVKKDPEVGPFTRFVFRPGSGLMGVYLGLVFAYGFIGFAAERLTSEMLQHVLFGIVATSNLLHFYYDGFIWKIREPQTGSALDVPTDSSRHVRIPGWFGHASKWAVLLAVVGVGLVAQRTSTMTQLQRASAIAERVPGSVSAHNSLAKALVDNGNYIEAIRACRAAEQLGQPEYRTHMYRGVALTAINQPTEGFNELQRAFELNSHDSYLRFHLAMAHIRRNQYAEALGHLKASVAIRPNDAVGQYNLGSLYLILNRPDDAISSLTKAIELRPDDPAAYRLLGQAYLLSWDTDLAIGHLKTSLQIDSNDPVTHQLMAMAMQQSGQFKAANDSLTTAIELQLSIAGSGQGAIQAATMADLLLKQTNRQDPRALELAARCYAAANRIRDAVDAASRGAGLAREKGDAGLVESLERLLETYTDQPVRQRSL